MELKNQTIAILGAARSGLSAARLARQLGGRPVVFDSGEPAKLAVDIAKLKAENIDFVQGLEGARKAVAAETFHLVVTSPGIDANWPLPRIFTDKGVSLIGEIEFAWRVLRPTPVAAITGTNGKTTTTELLERMFNHCGRKTIACGNYGLPLCEVAVRGGRYDVLTVEVSSFQLETITSFQPKVALWLNFAADHLDRYPDMESYFAAKHRIFEYMTAEDTAVVRAREPLGDIRPKTITFTTEPGVNADYTLRDNAIFHHGVSIAKVADLPLRELHNIENQMAALATGSVLGLGIQDMVHGLQGYEPARHRCEKVREHRGHVYYNDSKATNPHAVESCLRSQSAPVVLIAGGKEKGIDYSPFRPLFREKVTALVTIGEIAGKLCDLFSDIVPCQSAASIPEAVRLATDAARPGQAIILSPGTSSFDMFVGGYAERGNAFRDAVLALE